VQKILFKFYGEVVSLKKKAELTDQFLQDEMRRELGGTE
jgi:hypothetical protein